MHIHILEVLRHRLHENPGGEIQTVGFKKPRDGILTAGIAHGYEEFLILVAAADKAQNGLRLSVAEENLSFSVNYVFLKIVGNDFSGAEILHSFRYLHPEVVADLEESVDCGSCRKDYRRVFGYVDFLGPEFSGRERFHLEKRLKIEICPEFFLEDIIRRGRLRLLL